MKNIAILEYLFMMDPSETWTNLYQFEGELIKFFEEKGMTVQIVKAIEGSAGRRVLMIEKKPMPATPQPVLKTKRVTDYLERFKK